MRAYSPYRSRPVRPERHRRLSAAIKNRPRNGFPQTRPISPFDRLSCVACMLVFRPSRSLYASEPSVIIVQLKHGFGNQLFQYATARRLSLKLGVPLTLDLPP
jgi:hypothetical protein